MNLRDDLEAALGHTYAIDRELGGGGMSRVFTATETALGRKVVIKVVPMDFGAGVNVDRFKREILLAANLQHPHIVPVLTAGEMNGVPYYTMPFIDGESLRAKLERGGLPVGEVVSILRDVARALSYAHEHGVVHRDIKPDNVLLTGGSATVTDFGIAKAISASRSNDAESTLTQLGTSIGTPAYMAPEQSAADPSTDHRADIYSFGAMAYELLSGRPPFAGLSPHKLLAAHMSERPKPIAELQPDTPPLLADLIMQCLEKDPDARPQRASDLTRILDAVTSGTTSAVPAIATSGPGSLRRALLVYAAAFVAVFVLAKASIVSIGLPDWVLTASMILMALGLPVILATAYVQRVARRAYLSTPRSAPGAPATRQSTMAMLALKASPHLSWKRTAGVGAYGLGGFIGLVGLSMALRSSGVGPFASLIGAGKMKDRDKILVADFKATGGDSTLGTVVSEAVKADLGQSPIISVVTPQTVAAALERMQLPSNTRVDTAVARRIASREGIPAIVSGEITSLAGGAYIVSIRLVSADSGQELASVRESAAGGADLIPTIGKLTHQLRSKMGESLKHLQKSPELAQVTTASLEALQKYTAAQRALSVEVDNDKAIALFKEAVALDTSFASAYRALGIVLGNKGTERAAQIAYLEKAYAHADRLPEVERYLSTAAYWNQGPTPNQAKAVEAYQKLLSIRPTHYAALNNLALLYAFKRDFATAESLLQRSITANPSSLTAYGNLMTYQAEQGRLTSAESTLAAEVKVSGNNPRIALGKINILFARGRYDSVDIIVDSIAGTNPSARDLQQQRLAVRQSTAMLRGKLSESLRLSGEVYASEAADGRPAALLAATFDSAMVDAWFRGSKANAIARIAAGLKRMPLDSIKPLDRPYVGLAQVYAVAGRPDLARSMLAEFERTTSTMTAEGAGAARHSILSAIAVAEHRYLDAAHEAEKADVGQCTTCAMPIIAYAYDNAEKPDSAIAAYTKYVESASIQNRFFTDSYFLAGAYKRLGELWEAKGDKVKAAGYFTKFIALWKDADADLQPRVADARRRLSRLTDTEGKR